MALYVGRVRDDVGPGKDGYCFVRRVRPRDGASPDVRRLPEDVEEVVKSVTVHVEAELERLRAALDQFFGV